MKDGKADGVLNSQENVEALTEWSSWKEHTDPNTSGTAFPGGTGCPDLDRQLDVPRFQ